MGAEMAAASPSLEPPLNRVLADYSPQRRVANLLLK